MRALLASLLLCGCLQWEGDLMGLFLPRQLILVPLGLVTQPNQYGQYPSGALKIARNFVMRNPGELVQAPDVQSVVSLTSLANNVVHKLTPLDDGHVYASTVNGTTWALREGAGSSNSVSVPTGVSATSLFSSTGRVSPARVAERVLFNSNIGYLVGDFMTPSSAAERALRFAGFPQPGVAFGSTDSGNGWLLSNEMVGYLAAFKRETPDGYIRRSVGSPVFKFRNTGGAAINPTVEVRWNSALTLAQLQAGDVVEIYRTNILIAATADSDPGATLKLVLSYTLSTAEAASNGVVLTDKCRPLPGTKVTSGEEWYANPGQEGETYSNRQPPAARTTESFKGFAFFGSTTERAQWVFTVPGGFGSQATAVSAGATAAFFKTYGIGHRTGSGTVTSGSATITGISAADLVGIKVGQRWNIQTPPFPGTAEVQSIGATTITMSVPATGNDTVFGLSDVIELDGVIVKAPWAGSFFANISVGSASGRYEFTCDQTLSVFENYTTGFELTVEPNRQFLNSNTISVRGTNGANYSPPIPEINQTAATFSGVTLENHLQWSKEQQPEHAPSVSETFVGFGKIYAMNSTRDALWIWCSDGLFRLSGDAGALGLGNWQIDYANSTLILAAPQASTVLNEFMYAYTNVGFVEVDSAGNVVNLTDKVIGDLLPGQKYIETAGIVVERNETDEEVLLILGENGNGSSNTVYVFNTKQRSWTTLGSNGANLSNITALAMQRSPVSGEPRTLFGVSPLAGGVPSYSGWNSTSAFLTAEVQYQPIYGDDPLDLKKWIWADYLFDAGSNGTTMIPTFNGTQYGGTVTIQTLDTNGAFARAGVPREVGLSHSISPGFRSLGGAPQSRFQGISIPVKPRTNQSKKR